MPEGRRASSLFRARQRALEPVERFVQVIARGRVAHSEQAWDMAAPGRFLYEPIWTTAGGERHALFEAQTGEATGKSAAIEN